LKIPAIPAAFQEQIRLEPHRLQDAQMVPSGDTAKPDSRFDLLLFSSIV